MATSYALMYLILSASTASSVVRLSEVTTPDSGPETEALSGSVIWGTNAVVVYDPPGFLPQDLVRFLGYDGSYSRVWLKPFVLSARRVAFTPSRAFL